jgi:nucleoside-diphosphate-sugar epimerase
MAFTRIAFALATGQPFVLYGDGSQRRSFTYVSDVIEATVAAMQRGSGIYNVGGAHEASVREVIAAFERLAGRELDIREHPAVPGDPRRTSADTTRIRCDLDWEPRVSLDEGLQKHWEWAAARTQRGQPLHPPVRD